MKIQDGITWREKTRDGHIIRMAFWFGRGEGAVGRDEAHSWISGSRLSDQGAEFRGEDMKDYTGSVHEGMEIMETPVGTIGTELLVGVDRGQRERYRLVKRYQRRTQVNVPDVGCIDIPSLFREISSTGYQHPARKSR